MTGFPELARRFGGQLRLEERRGKYYGTHVLDTNGVEVIEFWTALGEPSEREKKCFGDWTPERWQEYVCDTHWECESDLAAALEFIALMNQVTR